MPRWGEDKALGVPDRPEAGPGGRSPRVDRPAAKAQIAESSVLDGWRLPVWGSARWIVRHSTAILGVVLHRVLVEMVAPTGAVRGDVEKVRRALGPPCRAIVAGAGGSVWSADLRVDADDPAEAMRVAHGLLLSACSEAGYPDFEVTRVEWTRRRWYGRRSEVWQRLTPGEPFAI